MTKDEDYSQEVELTEDELNFLNHTLYKIREKAIYPYSHTKLNDIREKVSDAETKAEEERRGNRPDCEEDGHTWGEQSIQDGWIIRGCNYCPKGQKRKSLNEPWRTREMSDII